MIAKPLNTNDMIATATGLATVSGPSTSMAGGRGGGVIIIGHDILYGLPPTEFFRNVSYTIPDTYGWPFNAGFIG